jgi:hypothetical protein
MSNRNIVTARSVTDNTHIFIKCDNTLDALRTAQKLHRLGEHQYRQIRLRSTPCNKKLYIMKIIEDIIS